MIAAHFPRRALLTLILALVCAPIWVVGAQDRTRLGEVWVTTQDYSALRAGPGTLWPKMTVVPFGVTLRATGRTLEADWIQVAYEGELLAGAPPEATIDGVTYGWIADWLLIWSGDILQLPLDGVPTLRGARLAGPVLEVSPRYIYVDTVDPSTRVSGITFDPDTTELTGRIGSPGVGFYWLQFRVGDQYYWTGTWDIGSPYSYFRLPDGSYIYTYGRLFRDLRAELGRARGIYDMIAFRWFELSQGLSTTCNAIPDDAAISDDKLRPSDLNAEAIYAPAVRALQAAIDETNIALALFRELCARQGAERYARGDEIDRALGHLATARASFDLAGTLIAPLQRRDPLLGSVGEGEPALNAP